jgi:hypothetical protein
MSAQALALASADGAAAATECRRPSSVRRARNGSVEGGAVLIGGGADGEDEGAHLPRQVQPLFGGAQRGGQGGVGREGGGHDRADAPEELQRRDAGEEAQEGRVP